MVTSDATPPPGIDFTVASTARVYDFWLGGKDNFAADRAAALAVSEVAPEARLMAVVISSPPADTVLDLGLCCADMSPPKTSHDLKYQRAAATRGSAQVTLMTPVQVASGPA